MKWEKYRLGDLCEMVRGEYPTMKTEPGEYPLVVTAAYRRTASTFQLEGPAVCIPLVSSTGHGDAALHRVHYQDG
jgi:type I restriction enzyme S subunit